jgi:hypothetical protein
VNPSIEIDIAFSRPGLIVLDEHGAVYRSQVFGNSCEQVAARGFFVPLDETLPEFVPEPVEDALGELLANAPYLLERVADEVDALLARYGETEFLRVDRRMLAKSGEAWVYVDIMPGVSCPLSGSGPRKGILVWANSD